MNLVYVLEYEYVIESVTLNIIFSVVTYERVEVQDLRNTITHHLRGIYRIYLQIDKELSTCNRMQLETTKLNMVFSVIWNFMTLQYLSK